ncbi:hypothetical protein [Vibrio mexicanus]|uniref:hypothetical protein n=1 Tax=Vibrio mexicanus TaxID=1004326 RepID=UPI00063C6862|nr:hypothetical protein [Vibrio mexicanus]
MDKVLFTIIAYNGWNLWEISPLHGALCVLLLSTVIFRHFVSNTINLDKSQSYGFFLEKGSNPLGCYEYTVLEHDEAQWKRLGIMYFSPSPEEYREVLIKHGIALLDGEYIRRGSIFSNLVSTVFFIIVGYCALRYIPQVVGDMFPEGHDRVRGIKINRSELSHNFYVWTGILFMALPLTFVALNEAVKTLTLVSYGGRRFILFLPDKVILTNGSGQKGVNQSLSIKNMQCIEWPHKENEDSVWGNVILDQTLKLIDVNGELVVLYDWDFGYREVLNHLVRLGVPVRLHYMTHTDQAI